MDHEKLREELEREIARNTVLMNGARAEGHEINVRELDDGRMAWYVPPELVSRVGYMCAIVKG